ncbi:MAG: glycosyltransferase family A protein [Ancrocorticia sp.]
MNPILTFVVPCYNSEAYMRRCIDSLLQPGNTDVEVVVVNDGSSDGTAWIADEYVARFPTQVHAVHKSNGGHGSAINAGLAAATGTYFKVVDSDDWLDKQALEEVLGLLRSLERRGESLDVLITNFVYEKAGKRIKRSVSYRRALPRNRIFGWNETHSFRSWQYLLMHSITYRTQLLRDCQLQVPERSFYVDNYFAFIPLSRVHKLYYLDVDFYRYYIGRSDQSVNERVMIGRIDQQININMLMIEHLSGAQKSGSLPKKLERYMVHYAALVTVVSSVLLVRDGSPASLAKKAVLWEKIATLNPEIYARMKRTPLGVLAAHSGKAANTGMRVGYDVARVFVGFN